MNRREYLLTVLSEECAEVAQRCTKYMRFGKDEMEPGQNYTNEGRLIQEINDLVAAAEMVFGCPISDLLNHSMIENKKLKVKRYMGYSRDVCGTLKEEDGK
jgi:hypothetical protein